MLLKNHLLSILVAMPALLLAVDPPITDYSTVDTDGPFVLYRGNKIVVKSIVKRDTSFIPVTQTYENTTDFSLHCTVSETNDTFSFQLHNLPKAEPDQYELPQQMLVLSDIEGDFKAFKMMLLGAKVIDKNFKWNFGRGHLMLLGDYFDRGVNVTECLWLIYKLEAEAEAAGGKVHFILGNHELLNLAGNTQYVRKKYLENARFISEPYRRLYDNNAELGRWLRTKNAVEKVGDYVFCHGGISPELAASGLSLAEVNRISRQYIGREYDEIPDANGKLVFDQKYGIFWYRNAAKNQLTAEQVALVLTYANAKRMVVGHTLQNEITGLYNGQVICVDLYHEENVRIGLMKTLLIESGRCYGINSKGETSSIFTVPFPKKKKESGDK